MRIAVFADVHGNLTALKAVLDDIATQSAEVAVCLGDLAFKGPQPAECVRLIRRLGIPCVYGNTDLALLHAAGHPDAPALPEGYSVPVAEVPYLRWHLSRMSESDLDYLAGLPSEHWIQADGRSIQFVHASPQDCNAAIRPTQSKELNLSRLNGSLADWVVMGHIHEPFFFRQGPRLLINTGAVGFSLDRNWRAAYAILDTACESVSIRRVEYMVDQAVSAARAVGFCFSPDWYGTALRTGWWEPIPWEQRAALDGFPW